VSEINNTGKDEVRKNRLISKSWDVVKGKHWNAEVPRQHNLYATLNQH